jgi:hypothetical protein
MQRRHNSTAKPGAHETRFLLLFRSEMGERMARVAVESLRAFGGPLRDCPVWAFVPDPDRVSGVLAGLEGIRRFPLTVEDECATYPFAEKVFAFAQAEGMAGPEIRSLVWLSLDCLVIQPPLLFDLREASGAARQTQPSGRSTTGTSARRPTSR